MRPTNETQLNYLMAKAHAGAGQTFARFGLWENAQRAMDNARQCWLKIEWQK